MQKKSEQRKELFRKERLRVKYGLEQKTRLHVDLMSHRASAQKYLMIKQCNYFADPGHVDWICYDKETKRSERREATAVRHGLRVVEGA